MYIVNSYDYLVLSAKYVYCMPPFAISNLFRRGKLAVSLYYYFKQINICKN